MRQANVGLGAEVEKLPGRWSAVVVTPPCRPAVDARGRVLVSVISNHSFYYRTAILDQASKSFTLVPSAIDGDASRAGWTPDGRILDGLGHVVGNWRNAPIAEAWNPSTKAGSPDERRPTLASSSDRGTFGRRWSALGSNH